MRFAEEVVAARFVPTWRGMLARELTRRGLAQTEIATLLGITQSAVSKHLRGELGSDASLEREPRMVETVRRVAEGLATRSLSPFQALHEATALVRAFEDRGPVCALHEAEMPELQGLGCDICVRVGASPLVAEQAVLADLRAGLRVLESTPGVARLIPRVGSNLVRAVPGATDATQVAAVPGQLFEMRGALKVPAPPEFGVSRFMAEVVLAVARHDASRLACLNLAPEPAFLDAARRAGLRVEAVAPEVERAPASLAFAGGVPDVFHHGGAFGVEPQAYVTGRDARSLALLVRSLVPSAGN